MIVSVFLAPEVLTKAGHGFEVDIWSIGCVLYTLLIGRPPFETDSIKETYRKIKEGDFRFPNSRLSPESRTLIKRMLQVDPAKRPSARKILQDDFIRKGFTPDLLPVTALTIAPRFTNAAAARTSTARASIRKPLQEVPQPKFPPTFGTSTGTNAETVGASKTERYAPMDVGMESYDSNADEDNVHIVDLVESLRSQVQNALEATAHHAKLLEKDDEIEVPSLSPMLFVVRWVDYSDKYGFGYQLSDDSIGVSFNDRTKVIHYPDGSVTFFAKDGTESHHDIKSYPPSWEKKIRLVKHFQQYMAQYLLRPSGSTVSNQTCSPRVPSLYTWFRTSKSVVMCLENGTVQINNFRSHRKLILCPVMGAISVIEAGRPLRTFGLPQIVTMGCTASLKEDLAYALGKLDTICTAAIGMLPAFADPIVSKGPAVQQTNDPKTGGGGAVKCNVR